MIRNIVLLTIDALRADHLSYWGYHRDTSPNIDAIASESLTFSNAYATSSHTRESVPSILTGHHPTEAINSDFSLAKPTIATLLPNRMATGAFHSNPYISRAFGFDKGFDHFDDDMYLGQNKYLALLQRGLDKYVFNRGTYHARAREINERSVAWIDSLAEEEPFFLWNHYMDPHGPYNPPIESPYTDVKVSDNESQQLYHRINEADEVDPNDHDLALSLYDGEIRYLDKCLANFIDTFKSRGFLSETLLIITADHGDLFGEYGRYGHPRVIVPELIHVPLVLRFPDCSPDEIHKPVSTLDIVPTILDNVGTYHSNLPGMNFLETSQLPEKRMVYSSATGHSEDTKNRRFAVWNGERGYHLKRDLSSGEILSEMSTSLKSDNRGKDDTKHSIDTEEYQQLCEEVKAFSESRLGDKDNHNDDDKAHPEVETRLEALGYK